MVSKIGTEKSHHESSKGNHEARKSATFEIMISGPGQFGVQKPQNMADFVVSIMLNDGWRGNHLHHSENLIWPSSLENSTHLPRDIQRYQKRVPPKLELNLAEIPGCCLSTHTHTAYDFELNLYRDGLVHALRYPKSPVEHRVENISHIRWIDPMKTKSSTGPEINSSKLSRYTTERPQLLPLQ